MKSSVSKSRKALFVARVSWVLFAVVGTVGVSSLAVPFAVALESESAQLESKVPEPSCHQIEPAAEVAAASSVAQTEPAQEIRRGSASTPNPFADRFEGIVLKTHEGKTVRFYEDLLKDKIVLINFMYATCKGR